MIILDTDVLSGLFREGPEQAGRAWLDRQPRASVWTTSVTVFEVRFGLESLPVGRRRTRLQQGLEAVLREDLDGRTVPFDTSAAEEAAALMASRRRAGRQGELRDTMIAGVAIARRATLATRNIRHFNDLPVLVIDPWTA